MKKVEVAKEWVKRTEEKILKEKKEIEIDSVFRKEFGFSPDVIKWDGDMVFALAQLSSVPEQFSVNEKKVNSISFAVSEIASGQVYDWRVWEYACFYNWEKKDGKYAYSVTLTFATNDIELLD